MKLAAAQPINKDARLVMEWRNDPLTRRMSFHQDPKVWAAFHKEFKKRYFDYRVPPPQFGVVDDVRVGFLRFRLYDDPLPAEIPTPVCDLSVVIAPAQRGKGYGTRLVALGTEWLHHKGWKSIIAEVKPQNDASIQLFEGVGYRFIDRFNKTLYDLDQEVIIVRYVHTKDDSQ